MKFRFAAPLALALLVTVPVFARRPEERHEGLRANHGRIPQGPPPEREMRAKPEVERHDSRVNSVPHVNNDHWSVTTARTTDAMLSHTPLNTDISNTSVLLIAIARSALIATAIASGFQVASISKLPIGIGIWLRIGAGTAVTISRFTTIQIMLAGICSTTSTPAATSMQPTWARELVCRHAPLTD